MHPGRPRRSHTEPAATDSVASRLQLVSSVYGLKDEERQGWVLRGVAHPESVADHSWGTAILCQLFARDAGVNRERAVAIALVHDLAEAVTGDVVARAAEVDRQVSVESKAAYEAAAMADLLSPESEAMQEVAELWRAYEERSDPAARFVRDMNLIDMCIQANLYERQRRYDPNLVVSSQGGFTHLDEFFVSAEQRLHSEVAKELFAIVSREYYELRARDTATSDTAHPDRDGV